MVDIGSLLPKVGECGGYRESPTKGGIVEKYEKKNEIAKTQSTHLNENVL